MHGHEQLIYFCPSCDRLRPLLDPCEHIQIAPAALSVLKRLLETEPLPEFAAPLVHTPTARTELDRACVLLLRCEPFLPQHLAALLRDVRQFLATHHERI